MKQDDLLWKGIIEDMPAQFLQFFIPDAEKILDFNYGFEFLDKELEELFPVDNPNHPRFVDKLIKAFTKEGREEWILIHIEVQGYQDDEFGSRMFTYFYRLLDRYHKPITALAIFTDDKKDYKPYRFDYRFLGTTVTYHFNAYKIIDQNEAELVNHANPFAIAVLTVLKAIQNKKSSDKTLLALKIDLFRMLHSRKMDKQTMRALANFLKMYVHFSKSETNRIFETETQFITNDTTTMGIEELILQRAEQKGIEKGIEKVVRNLISKMGLTDAQAADIAGVDIAFVARIRKEMRL